MDICENIIMTIAESGRKNQVAEDDYMGDDGLIHCGKCHGAKEKILTFNTKTHKVPVLCACRIAERQKEEAERAAREEMARISRIKAASLMDSRLRNATFNEYEESTDNGKVLRLAQRYAEQFEEMERKNQGLLFYGTVGTGKSFTAACIANSLMDKGISVIMTSFVKVLSDIRSTEDEAQYLAGLNRPKLLIIDDLGAERGTEYALEKVYNVVDSRVRANKPMILTTNLTLDEMMNSRDVRYQRIYDRILEVCFPVEMSWKSYRRRSAAERFTEMQKLMEG